MISYAGGKYACEGLSNEETGLISTVKIDMETFLQMARDADYLVYDANIEPIDSVNDLLEKNSLFEEFKAVKEGSVYIIGNSMYQNSDKAGTIINDLHSMITGQEDMVYLRKAR
jgi:iron complex transport system substrate-binding protein